MVRSRMQQQAGDAAVESVEEAVLNVLIAAETMTGKAGRIVEAIDQDRLLQLIGSRPDS